MATESGDMTMVLLKYFKQTENVNSKESSTLINLSGPLSKVVPSALIEETSKEVSAQFAESGQL